MSYTVEQLAAIKAARARGVAELQMGAERIKFRSLDEMDKIIASIEAELSPTPPSRRHYPAMTRGT